MRSAVRGDNLWHERCVPPSAPIGVEEHHNTLGRQTRLERVPRWNPVRGQHMRYVVIGFCIFAAACTGARPAPPAPAPSPSPATTTSPSPIARALLTREAAQGGSELPFT